MDLVFRLKESAIASLIPMEKRQGSLKMIEGGSSPGDTKGNIMAPIQVAITLS